MLGAGASTDPLDADLASEQTLLAGAEVRLMSR